MGPPAVCPRAISTVLRAIAQCDFSAASTSTAGGKGLDPRFAQCYVTGKTLSSLEFPITCNVNKSETCPMSTIVYRIARLLGTILADVPVGTNLRVFWRLWVDDLTPADELRHSPLARGEWLRCVPRLRPCTPAGPEWSPGYRPQSSLISQWRGGAIIADHSSSFSPETGSGSCPPRRITLHPDP